MNPNVEARGDARIRKRQIEGLRCPLNHDSCGADSASAASVANCADMPGERCTREAAPLELGIG
jgi:hypothetical protein